MIDSPGQLLAAHATRSFTLPPRVLLFVRRCDTLLHTEHKVYFILPKIERDQDRRCLPVLISWKMHFPSEIPQTERNKRPRPHDALAIHSDLHGCVGGCQDALCVQC